MDIDEVRALLRRRVDEIGGATAYARRHAVTQVYVSDVLGGRRLPGPAILDALGLRRVAAEARYEEAVSE